MRQIFQHITSPREMIMAFCAAISLLLGGVFAASAQATSSATPDGRLVTIHDSGTDKVVLTKAATIGDALKQAGVSLDIHDRVEPQRSTPLESNNYTVNIYRARPVIVVDGVVREKVMSAAQTPQSIVADAGVVLHDEDKTSLRESTDLVNDGASEVMTIDRATPLTLVLYGTSTTAYTQAKTVGAMLQEKHIKLAASDTVSLPDSTPITPNIQVAIWRNGTQTATQPQPIPFSVQQIQDPNQPTGYKQVQTPGQNGQQMVTYQINMQNGIEVSRSVIQKVVTQQPVQEVDVIGTKVSMPAGSHTDWMVAAGMDPGNYGYINYIFNGESHWNPAAASSSGYYGLGQTNLAKLSGTCGASWASDPVCQIGVFNSYAVSRYGSWANAAAHWQASHNW